MFASLNFEVRSIELKQLERTLFRSNEQKSFMMPLKFIEAQTRALKLSEILLSPFSKVYPSERETR